MLTWPKGLLQLQLLLLHTAWKMGSGQLHYSVLEESQHGTFVGRIAQDLGLEVSELVPRMFRMLSKGEKDYFEVNLQNGILFVNSRIDREELCAKNADCVLHLEVIVEKPLRFFHVEVVVKDMNDNAPIFSAREQILSIAELTTASGTRFPLERASDSDIGTNALLTYKLSPSNHFALDLGNDEDESKSVVLLLKVPLDREESPVHHLVLTATDGGEPKLTGTVQLVIKVLDVNDNPPVFNQSVYRVKLLENTTSGSLVITLNATDLDGGINREISYFFSHEVPLHVTKLFSINSDIGEIRVIGKLDYEDINCYELQIVAEDKGSSPLSGHCEVFVDVLDMNDNIPEVFVNSLSVPLPEDSTPGTVVAILSTSDKDSGINGQVTCVLQPSDMPFKIESTFKNYYSLIVGAPLDREQVAEYRMVVTVEDQGVSPLSSRITLVVPISDINDNVPAFTQPSYTVFVKENNPPGAHIFTISALDPDVAENALITYWIDEKLWPLSSYISVHSESGKLYALQSLNYEELKLLEFQVRAKDAGMPSLCGNVTVQVFVMDENDNAPVVSGLSEENLILLVVPVMPGHIVGKIHALDADSGYNAWLRYELVEENNAPWTVGLYSGEVSTKYSLDESEGSRIQSLLVLVKDHGKPQLSATATLSVSLVISGQTTKMDINVQRSGENFVPLVDSINVYLIIAICSVSSLFLLATLIYVALRCHCNAKESMVYGPGMATLVCASEVGSWSYSKRHSHILAGVSAEAGAKSDLMIFSPNIPVFANNGEFRNGTELIPDSAKEPGALPQSLPCTRSPAYLVIDTARKGPEAALPEIHKGCHREEGKPRPARPCHRHPVTPGVPPHPLQPGEGEMNCSQEDQRTVQKLPGKAAESSMWRPPITSSGGACFQGNGSAISK
ncbi:protocadherin alpha-5-like [Pituophis catenifer annectens]|uniref:protocadherin alpha-5-like n=1 Tax=Pituophis catenifer annectens TaxID=94852 RepID=UPI003991B9BF